ncbi:MAG: response regulator transcription factor [Christensenellaceae bacterium]
MAKQRILIIDDDKNIREVAKLYLRKEDFEVTEAADGAIGVDLFFGKAYDLVLLDIMMPVLDGLETIKRIRAKSNVPVIMLTAKGETLDKVVALELGADDYIVKPFDPKELVARVKAVIRRSNHEEKTDLLEYPNLSIDIQNYQVIYEGKELQMPPKEIELLHFLASRPNKVFTRDQLLEQVWGFEYFGDSRTVDVHVKRLREKFKEGEPWQIKTVWGVGYKFETKKA